MGVVSVSLSILTSEPTSASILVIDPTSVPLMGATRSLHSLPTSSLTSSHTLKPNAIPYLGVGITLWLRLRGMLS
uniref:Putative secreted protein n=1 Tax=Nyssomyia neivai TaxID=330878 RepID=A0A1L8DPH0_9DIPT